MKKLDLFELASRLVAEAATSPGQVRRVRILAHLRGVIRPTGKIDRAWRVYARCVPFDGRSKVSKRYSLI